MHDDAPASTIEQIVRPKPLAKRLGVHVTTLWRWCRDKKFPQPLQPGDNSIGWKESDAVAWLNDRVSAGRDPEPATTKAGPVTPAQSTNRITATAISAMTK
jgi:prophage regulatory protein